MTLHATAPNICALLPLALVVGVSCSARGQDKTIVSPNEYADVEADGMSDPDCCGSPFRYQQVFPASDFADLNGLPHTITQFSFRPDVSTAFAEESEWLDLQVWFALTSARPGDLSPDFEQNIQSNRTLAYEGTLTVSTEATGPPNGPLGFDQVFPLDDPFLYDPNAGNLSLELIAAEVFPFVSSDFFDEPNAGVFAEGLTATRGDLVGGLVTQFTLVAQQQSLQAGDADQNLAFNQLDLVKVQVAAKYLTGQQATWGEGDWNGAPGGQVGSPPNGNGLFDQLDIIAALGPGHYLTGPYAAIEKGGVEGDGQTSIVYHTGTGEVRVDAPLGVELTSVNINSAGSIFGGDPAQNLGGSFDNDADNNIFKATFGSSFGSLSFGDVAQAGLSEDFLLNDLTVVGSLAGGGALGDADLIYVPEPSTSVLLSIASFGLLLSRIRKRNKHFHPNINIRL